MMDMVSVFAMSQGQLNVLLMIGSGNWRFFMVCFAISGYRRYNISHRIHVWNIYLHLPYNSIKLNVAKYTIHGSYGYICLVCFSNICRDASYSLSSFQDFGKMKPIRSPVAHCAWDGSRTHVDILDSPILSKIYSPRSSLELQVDVLNMINDSWLQLRRSYHSVTQTKNRSAKGCERSWQESEKKISACELSPSKKGTHFSMHFVCLPWEVLQVPCSARHPPNGAQLKIFCVGWVDGIFGKRSI